MKVKHPVSFKFAGATPASGGAGELPSVLQTQVGALIGKHAWQSSFTSIVWVVKWTASGLMPVRPQIVATAAITIPVGRAALVK